MGGDRKIIAHFFAWQEMRIRILAGRHPLLPRDTVLVRLNESVRAGQKIAEVGESSSGVEKLRFELRQGGQPLNPMLYLQKK